MLWASLAYSWDEFYLRAPQFEANWRKKWLIIPYER